MRGYSIRLVIFGTIFTLLLSVLPYQNIAKAANDPFSKVLANTKLTITRQSATEATIVGRLDMGERGNLSQVFDETLSNVDIKLIIAKSGSGNSWNTSEVTFSNLKNIDGAQTLISGNGKIISLVNKKGEKVGTFDYEKGFTKDHPLSNFPAFIENEFGLKPSTNLDILLQTDPGGAIEQELLFNDNVYYIPSTTTGTDDNGIAQHQAQIWLKCAFPNLSITISKKADTPPSITLPKSPAGSPCPDRPEIKFILASGRGEGAFLWSNQDWYLFRAYINNKLVPNLYIVTNDTNTDYFYWANSDEVASEDLKKGKFSVTIGDPKIVNKEEFLGYILNYPQDGSDDCSGGTALNYVGPKEKYKTIQESTYSKKTTPSALEYNCINKDKNGWLAYWGVMDVSIATPGSCTFATITGGTIGDSISKFADCVVNDLFAKLIDWATEYVIDAAGLSYRNPNGYPSLEHFPGEIPVAKYRMKLG